MDVISFKDWLFNKFLEWEKLQPGKRSNFSAFARYLDVKQQLLSVWIKGSSIPGKENTYKLAQKLGDEIYTILDVEPPDPMLLYISANWERLPPNIQHAISDQISEYLAAQGEDNATNDAAYQP